MNSGSLVGSKLGKYQIESEIGRGGMGAVYRAYDPTLDRRVAIKILAPHLVWEKDFVERFMREARAAARLQHPNIVTIYDVGQESGWYYYVMEYLEGQSLTEIIQQQRPLAPESVIALLQPLGGALDYAHSNGLVHRDIKPGNIVVGRAGRVSLTDFGIARAAQDTRLTATGTTVGTPEYMSPEQVQGSDVGAPSDQYSLAVVAYEMLSGRVPFKADSTLALMYKVVHDPPPPLSQVRPELPAQVGQVLDRALAKDPRERYPTVTGFVEDLQRALAGQRVKAAPIPAAPSDAAPAALKEAGAGAAAAAAARQGKARQRRTPAPVPTGSVARQTTPPPVAIAAAGTAPPRERRGIPIWIWLLGGLTVVVLAMALIMLLAGGRGRGTPTPVAGVVTQVVTSAPQEASPLPPPTAAPSLTATLPPEAPTEEPGPQVSPPPTEAATGTAPPAPTSIPTEPSTATPSAEPTFTSTATAQPTATATTAAAPTQAPPAPTRTPTQPAAQFRAPNLLSPADGQVFPHDAAIVLEWEPVGQLPADAYYEPVVTYSPNSDRSQTWTDETPWLKETRWKLSEHNYLPGMAADGQIRWTVRVMRKTGENAQGRPVGTPLSPMNTPRTLTWEAPREREAGPTSPPP